MTITLYTFHDGTMYQDEKCLSSKETSHRDPTPNKRTECKLKTTNIQKYIGLLPHNLCIIYDLTCKYKMHPSGIITLHISF